MPNLSCDECLVVAVWFFLPAIFGIPLEITMKYEHEHGRTMPCIVEVCVLHLSANAMDVEGIFRYIHMRICCFQLGNAILCCVMCVVQNLAVSHLAG